ncbi:MAG TPA: DoxX family protein [Vicinamibacterales bacterium]|nr:DoxX family protein [Vicinamibacterales bacterium]
MMLLLLGILLGSFALLAAVDAVRSPERRFGAARRGQISLALVFLFTGLGHFVRTAAMAEMLPPWTPGRTLVIWISGLVEWLLAIGLLIPRWARPAGVAAMVFLVLVFPGNVYAAINRVEFGGHGAGPIYLLVRAPFQLLLIWWAYWFAVRRVR